MQLKAATPGYPPRILLIDSYDSFTYNLASLCRSAFPSCYIYIIRNDQISPAQLTSILAHFSAVVIGPGPGSPEKEADIGIVKHIWHLADRDLLPVFGVCLGLQSLAIEFGATLKRLNIVKHGMVSRVHHEGSEIFKDVSIVEAVRYHSLHVELQDEGEIECLAWSDDGEENGRVVMGAKHATKPFWGVQYHPESVRTNGGGLEVLRNFWQLAGHWSESQGRVPLPWSPELESIVGRAWPHIEPLARASSPTTNGHTRVVSTRVVESPALTIMELCEALGAGDEKIDFAMLDSAGSQPGRFSIVGCLSPSSPKITYRVTQRKVRVERNGKHTWEDLGSDDVWTWLASFMLSRRAGGGIPEIPFWGGFMGFLSYELGVHSLAPSVPIEDVSQPDVCLVFIERSVVFDSETGKAYVQSIITSDDEWMSNTETLLKKGALSCSVATAPAWKRTAPEVTISLPDRDRYISQIKQAKEYLYSGDSYELCLTAPTHVTVHEPSDVNGISSSWELYKTLRRRNPAPHSGYLRLHPSTLVSSSPERFLSFSRPPYPLCQLRPIKGTVRKAPEITRAVAEEMLSGNPKEVAENLMIVDLIRHDLHSVLGDDVATPQFCKVEEYKTVWQLVSVIEGKPSQDLIGDSDTFDLGWEVLRSSLPPGSMTGAPKKRSVEILHGLEGKGRSVYSGVAGYWCVGGGGDWSVIIRSCFKYDTSKHGDEVRPQTQQYTLGAGGAITALSDPVAEWEEMITKVESVQRAFEEFRGNC